MLQKGIKINYLCTITNGFGVEFLPNNVAVAISILLKQSNTQHLHPFLFVVFIKFTSSVIKHLTVEEEN